MTDTDKVVLKPADLIPYVVQAVSDNGEMNSEEIVRQVQEDEPEASEQAILRAITRLDRQGMLTRSNQGSGWQVTANGRSALETITSKQIASFVAPYDKFESVVAEYELISPSLGCVTGPGGAGKSLWPRLEDGSIVLLGGCVRAALAKAMDRSSSIVAHDLNGKPKKTPDAAWNHVVVHPTILPANTKLVERVRRPVNNRGMAIGEIVHEALPEGTLLRIEGEFPLSHFPEPMLVRMFKLAGSVGISPAGSGKGGTWGVARLRTLIVGGHDALQATEVTNGRALLHA